MESSFLILLVPLKIDKIMLFLDGPQGHTVGTIVREFAYDLKAYG